MKSFKFLLFCVFLVGLMLPCPAAPQSATTGAISGTVLDPSGATVSGAVVTMTNKDTGENLSAKTDAGGFYTFPLLKLGTYTAIVEKTGFRKVERPVTVVVGQNQQVNFSLEVGNVNETIQVEAAPPLLQTENANLATTFEKIQVENVPNGGNDMTAVAQTAPGVLMNTSSGGGYGNFTAFGLPATANLFTINGNDANDPFLNLNNSGATNLMLGTNEVQEVAVVSNGYTVQYGRQAGAQVDYATKSGTNSFHGNAVYWYNSGGLNANDFFNNATNTPLPQEVNNQWAWSVGGPIKKDKIFFFVDQEGLRYILGTSNEVVLPTPQFAQAVINNMQSGNSFVSPASVPFYQNIFNLYAGAPGINRAIPVDNNFDGSGNLGCGDLNTDYYGFNGTGANAVVPGFEQFGGTGPNPVYGGNNNGGGVPCSQWFRSTVGQLSPEWTLAAKLDVNFTDNDHVSLRYRMDRGTQATYTDPVSPIFNATSVQPEYDGQINWNHLFSSTKTNQLILSGLWYSAIFGKESTAAQATFPGALYDFDTNGWALIGGENNVFPQGRNVSQVQIVDDFSWIHGNHTFKIGGNYRYNKISDYSNYVRTVPRLRIFSTTDFVEGYLDQISQRFPNTLTNSVGITSWGIYLQDEWKVKSNLKLQFGLRVDRNTNGKCYQDCYSRLTEPFSQISHADYNTTPYNQFFVDGLSHAFPDLQSVAWEPRVSFSWSPDTRFSKPGTTVLRGGVGLFSDLYPGTLVDNYMHNAMSLRQYAIAGVPFAQAEPGNAYVSEQTCDSIFTGVVAAGGNRTDYVNAGNAAGLPCSSPDYNSVVSNVKYPLYIEWNMELQQAVGPKGVFSINYVGNHGINEFVYNGWLNVAAIGGQIQGLPALRPDRRVNNVNELTNLGFSNYNGLTATYTQRATKGLTFTFNYTYGHTSDMVSNGGILPYSGNDSVLGLVNPLCISCNYSNSDYDVRHNISANYVWQLPFKFSNKFAETVAGGWQISGTFFYRSGLPFSVTDNNVGQGGAVLYNALNTNFLAYPTSNVVPRICGTTAKNDTPESACLQFSDFLPSTSETAISPLSRNYFRGPGYFNSDFSVLKNFRLTEATKLGLGLNFYNVFNHANFANPVSDLASGQFGQIVSTVVPPTSPYGAFVGSAVSGREIQLTARFTF